MNALLLTTALALANPRRSRPGEYRAGRRFGRSSRLEVDGRPAHHRREVVVAGDPQQHADLAGGRRHARHPPLDLGPRGTMRVGPGRGGTGEPPRPPRLNTSPTRPRGGPTNAPTGTSGTGIPGAANGRLRPHGRLPDHDHRDPSARDGHGPPGPARQRHTRDHACRHRTRIPQRPARSPRSASRPVTVVLRRATGTDPRRRRPPARRRPRPRKVRGGPQTGAARRPRLAGVAAPRVCRISFGQNVTVSDGHDGRFASTTWCSTGTGTGFALSTTTTGGTT